MSAPRTAALGGASPIPGAAPMAMEAVRRAAGDRESTHKYTFERKNTREEESRLTAFKFRARTADGSSAKGVLEAYDEYEAVEMIRRTFPVVEKLTPVRQKRKRNIDLNEPLWVEDKSLSLAASQFAIMLRAGIPLCRVVELIADQTSDKLMRRILTACAADVAAGCSLAESLEKNGGQIPAVFIESVRSGEESGTLEESFDSLKLHYERAHRVKSKARSALTYPITLLVIAAVTIAIVMTVLVPRLTEMLDAAGRDLPGVTRALIAVSRFFRDYWALVAAALAGAGLGTVLYNRTEEGRVKLSAIRMRLPVVGRIARMNTAAQIANTMSTLLRSGLPVTRVAWIVSCVLDMRCVGEDLARGVGRLETGQTLAEVLGEIRYIPKMLVEMIRVGERSGSLEGTLRTIGEFYDAEAERASDRALGMLEPMITVIMGVVVGFIVIALYSAIFAMTAGAAGSF